MIWIAIGGLTVWLLVLTIGLAAVVHYLGTLNLAREAGPLPLATLDLDAAGPAIGSELPSEALLALPDDVVRGDGERALLFLSPGCGICLEAAAAAGVHPDLAGLMTVVMPGVVSRDSPVVADMVAALGPLGETVLVANDARTVMQTLKVDAIPFVLTLVAGRVTNKLFVRRASQLDEYLGELHNRMTAINGRRAQ